MTHCHCRIISIKEIDNIKIILNEELKIEISIDDSGMFKLIGKILLNEHVVNTSQSICILKGKVKLGLTVKDDNLYVLISEVPFLSTKLHSPLNLNQEEYTIEGCSSVLLETINLINPESEITPYINLSDEGCGWILKFSKEQEFNIPSMRKIYAKNYLCRDLDEVKRIAKNNKDLTSIVPNSIVKSC